MSKKRKILIPGKKKCIDNPILGNQDKNNAHFYLKIFNILFTEYPKPSIIYLSNNSDSFIQNLNQFNTEFIEKLDPHKIIEIYEGIIFLVFQNDDFDIYNFFDNLVKNHIQTTKYYNSELIAMRKQINNEQWTYADENGLSEMSADVHCN